MKPFLIVLAIAAAILLLAWIGLKVKPAPFAPYAEKSGEVRTMPLPGGLPAPVERFYHKLYGDEIPVIESVVITGRGTIRPVIQGPALPARFVIVHNAGKDYRHYFEATIFGIPFIRVNEGYIDGESFFESPMGSYTNDPNTNQGANLALWAEGSWFPALLVTDPRVRWEPVDENSALLYVPYGDQEENFVVRFNPETGLIDLMEAMRYRNPGDTVKILWICSNVVGSAGDTTTSMATGSAMWLDHGKPWAYLTLEDIVYNVDVGEYILQRGK
jgi:hypothetical protein